MTALAGLVAIFASMLAEQVRAAANERRLRARGAIEPPGDVFRAMALVYPLSFAVMGVEGMLRGTVATAGLVSGVLVFVGGKLVKYWAIATLGERWSFRVLVLPGEPLVSSGPYRFVRHPNYLGLAGEFFGATLWFGAVISGPVVSAAFGYLLWRRLRVEDRALDASRLLPRRRS